MERERIILHCDLNNFYASAEELLDPSLKGAPLAVAGDPEKRHGVVLAKNARAKALGIKTGDTIWQAKQKAPELVVVPPHFNFYQDLSKKAFDLYTGVTDMVEPFGADECWLDCTGSTKLFGSGVEIADRLRAQMKDKYSLTISVGVSFNKIFAKLGSDLKKPDAVTVIGRDDFKRIVWQLPAGDLFMIGRKTAEKLAKLNIRTIGDVAAASEQTLRAHFGINGIKIKRNAMGLDDEPVRSAYGVRAPESVGHGMTATRDIVTFADADALLYYLSDLVAVRLRKKNMSAGGIRIDLRSNELRHVTRQTHFARKVSAARDIADIAERLLRELWHEDPPLRTLTVQAYDLQLGGGAEQLNMFDPPRGEGKNDKLERALDHIRARYGKTAILRADLVQRDFVYDKTDGEDFLPFMR